VASDYTAGRDSVKPERPRTTGLYCFAQSKASTRRSILDKSRPAVYDSRVILERRLSGEHCGCGHRSSGPPVLSDAAEVTLASCTAVDTVRDACTTTTIRHSTAMTGHSRYKSTSKPATIELSLTTSRSIPPNAVWVGILQHCWRDAVILTLFHSIGQEPSRIQNSCISKPSPAKRRLLNVIHSVHGSFC